MPSDLQTTVHTVVERAPQWLRHDLTSQDKAMRTRAEETISAMIADALSKDLAG